MTEKREAAASDYSTSWGLVITGGLDAGYQVNNLLSTLKTIDIMYII
jgi:hypothetical protein